jgi:hypothetical protein
MAGPSAPSPASGASAPSVDQDEQPLDEEQAKRAVKYCQDHHDELQQFSAEEAWAMAEAYARGGVGSGHGGLMTDDRRVVDWKATHDVTVSKPPETKFLQKSESLNPDELTDADVEKLLTMAAAEPRGSWVAALRNLIRLKSLGADERAVRVEKQMLLQQLRPAR